jgi:hypothetical protein
MNKQSIFTQLGALLLLAALPVVQSCKDDDHDDHDHEGEVITTVRMTFTDSATSTVAGTFEFNDPDGPGGNPPQRLDTIDLQTGKTYLFELRFIDASKSPAHDITHEIREEAKEHLVCFTDAGSNVVIVRTDSDGTHPIGLSSKWNTPDVISNGKVRVQLKHQPGVKNGQCEPGDTDVEVDFPVRVR